MIRLDLFFRQDRFILKFNFFYTDEAYCREKNFFRLLLHTMHQDVSSLYSCKMTKFMQKLGFLDGLQGF